METILYFMNRAELTAELWIALADTWDRSAFDRYITEKSDPELRSLVARFRGAVWLHSGGTCYDTPGKTWCPDDKI